MFSPLDFPRFRLQRGAEFRDRTLARFPADIRNEHAARALRAILAADEVSPEIQAALVPLQERSEYADAVQAVVKEVGFRIRPKTLQEFLEIVIQRVSVAETVQ